MRQLILLRHAKAVRAHEAPDDRSRGLTERGRRDGADAGAALAAAGLRPQAALVSPATRTRETAAYALAPLAVAPSFVELLYEAGPRDIWRLFAESDAASVVIIGHNPGLAELAEHLIEESHDRSALARSFSGRLPTSAWVAFDIGAQTLEAPGSRLIGAWRPKGEDD